MCEISCKNSERLLRKWQKNFWGYFFAAHCMYENRSWRGRFFSRLLYRTEKVTPDRPSPQMEQSESVVGGQSDNKQGTFVAGHLAAATRQPEMSHKNERNSSGASSQTMTRLPNFSCVHELPLDQSANTEPWSIRRKSASGKIVEKIRQRPNLPVFNDIFGRSWNPTVIQTSDMVDNAQLWLVSTWGLELGRLVQSRIA